MGYQQEILSRLSKIGDLKVISRTSTENYKGPRGNLREIAKQLGVEYVVEGSVQKKRRCHAHQRATDQDSRQLTFMGR